MGKLWLGCYHPTAESTWPSHLHHSFPSPTCLQCHYSMTVDTLLRPTSSHQHGLSHHALVSCQTVITVHRASLQAHCDSMPTSTLLLLCPLSSLPYHLLSTSPAFICVLLPVYISSLYVGQILFYFLPCSVVTTEYNQKGLSYYFKSKHPYPLRGCHLEGALGFSCMQGTLQCILCSSVSGMCSATSI